MFIIKKLIQICFGNKLKNIFHNDEEKISLIFENFSSSYKKFNFFLKLLIFTFLLLTVILNFLFVFIYFFKFKINFYSEVLKFISRVPYIKNINNFILANLFLHFE